VLLAKRAKANREQLVIGNKYLEWKPKYMNQQQPNNPLHGVSLETIVTELELRYGWDDLAQRININCFKKDPSVKSSLKFLRKTPWAREKVEQLYVRSLSKRSPQASPTKPPKASSNKVAADKTTHGKLTPWGTYGKEQDD